MSLAYLVTYYENRLELRTEVFLEKPSPDLLVQRWRMMWGWNEEKITWSEVYPNGDHVSSEGYDGWLECKPVEVSTPTSITKYFRDHLEGVIKYSGQKAPDWVKKLLETRT